MEIRTKNQMEVLETNTVTEMKNVFELISGFDTAQERISELEDKSVEITQMEYKKKKWERKRRGWGVGSPASA